MFFSYFIKCIYFDIWTISLRTSHRRCSVRKYVLRNFAKFAGKHLCQSLSLNKVEGLKSGTLSKKRLWHWCFPVNFVKFLRTHFRSGTLLKKRLWHWCFPVNFAKFLRTHFLTEHLWTTASVLCYLQIIWAINQKNMFSWIL